MTGVICGPERVIASDLKYLSGEGVWRFDLQFEGSDVEFIVSGDSLAPHQARLHLAERVAYHLADFSDEARAYLRLFVGSADGGLRHELVAVEFGRRPTDTVERFELHFLQDGDQYGLWGVCFSFAPSPPDRFYAYEFFRRQT